MSSGDRPIELSWAPSLPPRMTLLLALTPRRLEVDPFQREAPCQLAKSGVAERAESARPLGSSHSSWRPSAVRSRK